MSITNSEVESAMNHRYWRAVLGDCGFSKEAFDAFSSVDAYIRAAQDGLARATDQHPKDMRALMAKNRLLSQELEKCQSQLTAATSELEKSKEPPPESLEQLREKLMVA
ncbi:uncharacterized protein [Triticum aestivum]|uniref:uncharacterized protein n=1 Tax=Triticum aestivum TaxID=4565 RepID=UPI001D02C18C|nr:uncharacterized protein LOC123111300 [Triticum aestivum]